MKASTHSTNIVTNINTTTSTHFFTNKVALLLLLTPSHYLPFSQLPTEPHHSYHHHLLNPHVALWLTSCPSDDLSQIISYLCPRRSLPRLLPSAKSQGGPADARGSTVLYISLAGTRTPAGTTSATPSHLWRRLSHLAATQKLLQPFTCYTFN